MHPYRHDANVTAASLVCNLNLPIPNARVLRFCISVHKKEVARVCSNCNAQSLGQTSRGLANPDYA